MYDAKTNTFLGGETVSCFPHDTTSGMTVTASNDLWKINVPGNITKKGEFLFPFLDIPTTDHPWIFTISAKGARFNQDGKVYLNAYGFNKDVNPEPLCVTNALILKDGNLARFHFSGRLPSPFVRFFQNPTNPQGTGPPPQPSPVDVITTSEVFAYPWEKGIDLASLEVTLNDSDATARTVFEPFDISQLPIAGNRSIDSLALLTPGVSPPPQAGTGSGPGISPSLGTAGEVVVNGIRPRLNNFTVDGVDNNDEDAGVRREGFVFSAPYSLESIREFQVLTSLYDPQFGRGSGGQLNVLTKTGTGQFHATAYGYLSDAALGARNYFNPAFSEKDPNTSYATGVVLDVPTGRNFFLSLGAEWRQDHAGQTNNFAVPTAAERSFQDSAVVSPVCLNCPASAGVAPLPNSTLGDAVFSLFPFPNNPRGPYGANTYTEQLPANGQGILYSAKLDRSLSRLPLMPNSWSHRLYISGAGTAESSTLPETGDALFSALRPNVHTDIGSVILTTNAGAAAANSLRLSFGEAFYIFGSAPDPNTLPSPSDGGNPFLLNRPLLLNQTALPNGQPNFVLDSAYPTTESFTGPLGEVSVAGYSGLGIDVFRLPQHRRDQTMGASDLFTFLPGQSTRTTVSIGFEFWHYRFSSDENPNALPYLAFNGAPNLGSGGSQPTFFSPADTVSVGLPSVYEQTLIANSNTDLNLYRNQVDIFAGVNRRLGRSFTITAGARVEANGLPYSTNNYFESKYYSQTLPTEECFGCPYFLSQLQAAFPPNFTDVFSANHVTADPRIGIAWDPTGSGNWAVRGGIGKYTSQFPASILDESRNLFPNSYTLNGAGAISLFLAQFAGGIPVVEPGLYPLQQFIANGTTNTLQPQYATNPAGFLETAGASLVSEFPAGHLLNPYALQAHLAIERKLGDFGILSVAYAGTEGRHLLRLLEDGPLGYTASIQAIVPFYGGTSVPKGNPEFYGLCGFNPSPVYCGGVAEKILETGANSSYHSLQIEFRNRFRPAGLQFGAAVTYSHSIDDASDLFDTAGEFAAPQDSNHANLERASSAFDVRWRVPLTFDWQPPLRQTNRYFGGWHLTGIVTAQTGMPFTVNTIYALNSSGTLNGRLETTSGLILGPVDGDSRVMIGAVSAAMIPQLLPAYGADGAVGRNTFRASGLSNADLSIGRTFALAERKNLRVRLESFNALNHPEFGIPVRLLGAPGFGTSVATSVPNRRVQLNLQVSF